MPFRPCSPENATRLREEYTGRCFIIELKTRTKSSGEEIPGLVRSIGSGLTIAGRETSGSASPSGLTMMDKRIPVTEAAQRAVDAVEEIVSFELRGNSLRFNFDHPRRIYPARIVSSSATIFVGEQMVVDGSEQQVIRQLRKMLDGA